MKKSIINTAFVICCISILTFVIPYWNSVFTSIPGKMFAGVFVYIVFIALILLFNFIIEKDTLKSIGFQKDKIGKQIVIGTILSLLLASIFFLIPFILGASKTDLLPHKPTTLGILFYYIILRLIFVGLGEELIFRGYLFEKFKKLTNSGWWTVVITSILFGIWHFILSGSIAQVIVTSIIGFLLGFARFKIKDCSIISLSLGHGIYDALLVILSWFLL